MGDFAVLPGKFAVHMGEFVVLCLGWSFPGAGEIYMLYRICLFHWKSIQGILLHGKLHERYLGAREQTQSG
jgi:hypothetical protein